MSGSELKAYKGNCHCGAFKFEVNLPEVNSAMTCNCSICSRKGYMWAFPGEGQFKIMKGAGTLTTYEFAGKNMAHMFCPICGTGVMGKINSAPPGQNTGINIRALLDVNPFKLETNPYDGKALQPSYTPPPFTGDLPEFEGEGLKVYTGGCHCGAVTVAVKTKPLPEVQVKEDNCSICQRNSYVCIYPHQSQVSIVGEENATEYLFGKKFTGHRFCKVCGVPVYMKLHGPPKAIFDSWSEARREAVKKNSEILPVRVAILNDVEWDQVKVERSDEGTDGYVVE